VTAVEADWALDVYLLSDIVGDWGMTIPRALALELSSLSSADSVCSGVRQRTSLKYLASLSSGSAGMFGIMIVVAIAADMLATERRYPPLWKGMAKE
jgi:hypothetical protein